MAIAKDHGAGRRQCAKSVHALFCTILLPETYGDIEEDDAGENTSFNVILDTKAESHGKNENLDTVMLVSQHD